VGLCPDRPAAVAMIAPGFSLPVAKT
jgi:hypothetical protein